MPLPPAARPLGACAGGIGAGAPTLFDPQLRGDHRAQAVRELIHADLLGPVLPALDVPVLDDALQVRRQQG